MKDFFKYFFLLSDIHIGKIGKTEKIVSNLISFFIDNRKILSETYVIVITGDLFDRLLSTIVKDYMLGLKFIGFLVSFCKTYDIKLRILEGTPSHDHKQMASITGMIKELENIDFKYIDTLYIEYIDGMTWMYLPDKYKDSGEEIQEAVVDKLKEHKLDKVDFLFAHGNFSYQLPVKIKSALDESFFLSIVNYYIIIGHVHNRSIWKRIIAPGSFDRLEVNQESDKGGVLLKIGKNIDNSEFEFLNNTRAIKFDTLDLGSMNVKEAYKAIVKHAKDNIYDEYDHLRIKTSVENFKELEDRLIKDGIVYTLARFIEKEEKNKTTISIENQDSVMTDIISITPSNIKTLLEKRDAIMSLSKTDRDRLFELIEF